MTEDNIYIGMIRKVEGALIEATREICVLTRIEKEILKERERQGERGRESVVDVEADRAMICFSLLLSLERRELAVCCRL